LYSSNKTFNLSMMSETFFPEASLYSVKAFSRSWIFHFLLLRDLARSSLLARRSSATFEDLSWFLRRFSIKLRSSSWVFYSFSKCLLDCSSTSSATFFSS
jgi:hypothetical protein